MGEKKKHGQRGRGRAWISDTSGENAWCRRWMQGKSSENWRHLGWGIAKAPESPLNSKETKPLNLKGNQPWVLIGRADAEAETQVFWSSDANSWLIGKVPDTGKDWGQKEKRVSEDEIAGWHHWCNGHELGQTSGGSERQGGLACCSPWGCKESDTTGWLTTTTTWSLLYRYICWKVMLTKTGFIFRWHHFSSQNIKT